MSINSAAFLLFLAIAVTLYTGGQCIFLPVLKPEGSRLPAVYHCCCFIGLDVMHRMERTAAEAKGVDPTAVRWLWLKAGDWR